jgi:biopolymer transport protein ExbD
MARRVPLRVRFGLVLILTAAAIYGGYTWWMATRTWVPLDMAVSLAQGHIRSPEFKINLDAGFWIFIEVETKPDPQGVACLIGYQDDSCRKNGVRELRASWTLSDSGRVVAQGSTEKYPALRGGMVTKARGLGDFVVPPGKHYVLDVDIQDGGSRFDAGHPRLWIAQRYYWLGEDARTALLLIAALLAQIGAVLLASALAEAISRKREAQRERVRLTWPGPLPAGFVFESASAETKDLSVTENSMLPRSAWLGLALLLFGAISFVAVRHWHRTRIFTPVDMPVSLTAGHIRTGPFRINLRAKYWVGIETGEWWMLPRPCQPNSVLQTKWELFRKGKVVGQYDDAGGYFSEFEGEPGVYDLDFQIVSDASCLNQAHPRLRVWTDSSDYEFYAGYLEWAAAICFAAGVSLIILQLVGRLGWRAEEAASLNLSPSVGSSSAGQNFQWAQRLPLRRPISGLPGFGVVGVIIYALTGMVMMVLTIPITPKGMWVHVLKPGDVPAKSDSWTEPLVVRVTYAGPGREPRVFVNSRQVSWGDLGGTLMGELSRRRDWVAYVEGDSCVSWTEVANVIDMAHADQAKVVLVTGNHDQQDCTPAFKGLRITR